MKVEFQTRLGWDLMTVTMVGRTWPQTHDVVEQVRDKPPEGYKLMESRVTPRHTSGQRTTMALTFRLVDDRAREMTQNKARLWFREFARLAMEEH